MTTIGIITDAHANLPALEAALDALDRAGCEIVIHCGDAIGIGPHPAECLDLLLNRPNTHLLMGNHDEWFAFGLPTPRPEWMSAGEWEHQQWTHAQLPPDARGQVAVWPDDLILTGGNRDPMAFCHYPREPGNPGFAPIIKDPGPDELDTLFGGFGAGIVFYGHHHPRSDIQGTARYVNPGALGCNTVPEARYAITRAGEHGRLDVTLGSAAYDWSAVLADFDRRNVPERDVIRRIFFGQPG